MRSLLLAFLTCYSFNCLAQLPAEIKFTNYTRANGLPEEQISNIIQDSRGFMWMGSREGLFRFDGKNYKAWYADPTDSTRFSNNAILVIGEYRPGKLLFLSGAKLWEIDIANHKIIRQSTFAHKTVITVPCRLSTGGWFVSDIDSAYITDPGLNILHSFSLRPHFPISLVSAFYLQHPWILMHASGSQHFHLYDYLNKKLVKLPVDISQLDSRSKFFLPTAYDSISRHLYLSSYFNGNFYLKIEFNQKESPVPVKITAQNDGAIRKSIFLNDQKILVQAGINGLYFTDFNKATYFTTESNTDKPIVSNVILDLFKAKDGDYWVATTNGVSRFSLKPPVVKYYKDKSPANAQDEIKKIIKGPGNNLYYLRQNRSLYMLDPDLQISKRLDSSIYYCWSIASSGDEILIGGAGKRLASFNTKTKSVSNPSFLQPYYTNNTDIVTLIYRSNNGDMWYSCNGSAGIIRKPFGKNEFIHYSRNSSPPAFSHSYVHNAAEDSHGNIYWGSNKTAMLLIWNASTESFREQPIDELIPQNKLRTGINNIYIDAEDNLWIAMDAAALLRYNLRTKTGNYYDINKGLPTDAVFGMCSDNKNRLWFTTRKGLCCLLPDKEKVISFTTSDGLPEDNFEGDAIYYDHEDHRLYLGCRQTISWFNPDTLLLKSTTNVPPVFIDEMLVNGKLYYYSDYKNIRLATNENNIEFNFSSPDFRRNDQLVFQYRLQGNSNQWIDLGDKRNVTFNGLNYGKYTLSVRSAYKGTDNWQETTSPISFAIKTPLQKQTWFRIVMGLLAVCLILFIIRDYYRRKLEKQLLAAEKIQAIEKERTRIATDMHDDFGANLSRIKFISEKMQLTQTDNPALKNDLSKISIYSDEMAEKMNEIVWALNQRYDSIEDLVSFCRSYASEYLMDKDIILHFKTAGISERMIKGETRRNIFLVIKEALHNIVKHSNAREVTIEFNQNERLNVLIADNGKGFEKDSVHQFANGLENMKKRISDINGELTISSDNGTIIQISVPL